MPLPDAGCEERWGRRDRSKQTNDLHVWRPNGERRNVDLEPDIPRLKYGSATWVIVGKSFYCLSLGVLTRDILRWLRWFLDPMSFTKAMLGKRAFQPEMGASGPRTGNFYVFGSSRRSGGRTAGAWQELWLSKAGGWAWGLRFSRCWIWDYVPSPGLCLTQAVHTREKGRLWIWEEAVCASLGRTKAAARWSVFTAWELVCIDVPTSTLPSTTNGGLHVVLCVWTRTYQGASDSWLCRMPSNLVHHLFFLFSLVYF